MKLSNRIETLTKRINLLKGALHLSKMREDSMDYFDELKKSSWEVGVMDTKLSQLIKLAEFGVLKLERKIEELEEKKTELCSSMIQLSWFEK